MRTEPTITNLSLSAKRLIDETPRGRLDRTLADLQRRVSTNIVVLDSELAGELLAGNVRNRTLKARHVARLQESQRAGKWAFNGEPICVADTGRLLNGQHRCAMVVESGEPIIVLLVRGLDESVFSTYDTGARRTAADVLHILGQTNCAALASALGWIERYYAGEMESATGVQPFSVEELLEEHPGLIDSVRLIGTRRKVRIRPGLLAAMHYLFRQVSQEQADKFVNDLDSGIGLQRQDSVYLLRERLLKNDAAKAKLSATDLSALVIKAWNYRRRGAPCGALRWRTEGDKRESFPRIDGLTAPQTSRPVAHP